MICFTSWNILQSLSHLFHWEIQVVKSTTEGPSGRHPDLWRVDDNRWVYSEYATPYERLLARSYERVPGIEQGETLETADLPDRASAIELACEYIRRHAEEAVGRTTVDVRIAPPDFDRRGFHYEVPPEVMAQARRLGLKGDVAAQIRSLIQEADVSSDGRGNLQACGYLLRIERGVVTWIGETDTQRRHRRGKRST